MSSANVIHPTAVVEDGVSLGAGCVIHPYVVLRAGTVLGERVVVHSFSVIGGEPQDLKFDPAVVSGVKIGSGTVIREHCTVHRASTPGGFTVVGENSFLMATSHVGHDSQVGNRVVLANAVLLAGFTEIGDGTFVGGGAAIHQFCRIGEGVMIGGLARITSSVPPFSLVAERSEMAGLNVVGLRRSGLPREVIRELKDAFRTAYFTPGNIRDIAARTLEAGTFKSAEARRFLEFFTVGRRMFARPRRSAEPVDSAGG